VLVAAAGPVSERLRVREIDDEGDGGWCGSFTGPLTNGGAEPGAPDDMTGLFRPHLGDAGRAISVAAAGVCLLGLAFGDPGKFLQADGHVLV
jgi:hypothetical protein